MRRVPELDGLRGLAAAYVVAHHLWPRVWAFRYGYAAVDLFFALSGYLITGIILENGGRAGFLKTFYARRCLRIWPIYYLAIAVALLCTTPEPGALPYYLTYTQNLPLYWGGHVPVWHEMVHTWTLAVEEQFYLLWPALLLCLGRARSVAVFAALVALGSLAARSAGLPCNLLLARCDGFALGGVLACLMRAERPRAARALGGLATAAGLAALAWEMCGPAVRPAQLGYTASVLFSFAALAAVVTAGRSWATVWLRLPPLVYLGTVSYGLYLYHYPIMLRGYSVSARLGVQGTWAEPVLFALLSLAAAALSWHLIEAPILGLKRWFGYRPHLGRVARPGQPGQVDIVVVQQAGDLVDGGRLVGRK